MAAAGASDLNHAGRRRHVRALPPPVAGAEGSGGHGRGLGTPGRDAKATGGTGGINSSRSDRGRLAGVRRGPACARRHVREDRWGDWVGGDAW